MAGREPDESSQVERWRAGDREACAALFDAYYPGVARFFRSKAPSQADDLVQQTFLRCFCAIERLREPAAFRSFLFAIAYNVLREHLRERASAPVELESQRAIDLDPTPSTLVVAREQQRLLIAALRRIPLAHQIVLELHYWERMSAAEIAGVLDEPVGTIKTRLRRARVLLERALAEVARAPELLTSSLAELERWAAGTVSGPVGGRDADEGE